MKELKFPLYVKWSVTNRCNLRCSHCFHDKYDEKEISINDVEKIVDKLHEWGVIEVLLTGGEPLVRKDLNNIINYIHSKNILIGLATNGMLLNENRAKNLPLDKLSFIQVSLDGHNSSINDNIRGKGVFESVIRNIIDLKKKNINLILAHTINKKNIVYFKEMINLAKSLKVDILRFEIFLPLGQGKLHNNNLFLSRKEIQEFVKVVSNMEVEGLKIEVPNFNSECGCGAGFYTCIINNNLSLSPCDLLPKLSTDIPVNISDLKELWLKSSTFTNWRIKYKQNKLKGCLLIEELYRDS
ncbi:radical SAM protein (plasmid) [Clostridium beijerinckii]|uniref:radical SAM protein n=1 Tax=Clostridium beijerinckii TaxID=1520 RepID=UPI002227D558|nr:radical SAM protein [Clostridium beijerinckii]UYZ39122.1 radical SAM protein [Clostridium beijerinckii]